MINMKTVKEIHDQYLDLEFQIKELVKKKYKVESELKQTLIALERDDCLKIDQTALHRMFRGANR